MCNEVQNELYRLRAQGEKKQNTLIKWLKNSVTGYVPYFPMYPGICWDSTLKHTTTTFFLTLSIHQL
jgi:hypothetical protein